MGLICLKLCINYSFLDENTIFACDSKDSATHLSLIDLLMVAPNKKIKNPLIVMIFEKDGPKWDMT